MHRQSLGSPAAAKLHGNANGAFIKEISSSSSLSPELQKKKPSNNDDEKQNKKPHKTTPSGQQHPEKFIHLIPILTLLCFFILYLNSHDPSQNGTPKKIPLFNYSILCGIFFLLKKKTFLTFSWFFLSFILVSDLAQFNGFKTLSMPIGTIHLFFYFYFLDCVCVCFFFFVIFTSSTKIGKNILFILFSCIICFLF